MPSSVSSSTSGRIAVVGSLNLDYFTRVESLPTPGETVAASKLTFYQGGKGANQAVAAARQGASVSLIGCVGADEGGSAYLRALEEEGISLDHVRVVPGATGSAFITVDREGENMIVIAPGANSELRRQDVQGARSVLETCDVLLCQFEVPTPALVEAIQIANRAGVTVVVNPSPLHPAFPWEDVRTEFLIANENEAASILEFEASATAFGAVAERLQELRADTLIVTRGGDSTLSFSREGGFHEIPVLSVLPVDTVGAGDAFAGCFSARISQGASLEAALRAANCAGALTTLGPGAQDPMPGRDLVDQHEAFLPKHH